MSQDGSAFAGERARYYMNKAFGRGLERARALDEGQNGSELQRATIEPLTGGGHRVVVERSSSVVRGGRTGPGGERSEHSFGKPEDALRFLQDLLHGRLPDVSDAAGMGERGTGPGSEEGEKESRGSVIEDVLGDVLKGDGDRP
jgi:hypothetical protein